MFDIITGEATHLPRHQGAPIVISTSVQLLIGTLVLAVPYLYVTNQLPEVPTMMAFVATVPPPPPPPPPPAPAPKAVEKAVVKPDPSKFAAPVEAPREITPEPVSTGGEEGVPGGVEGGVPGGVVGGIVGGIPDVVPPPPPQPPPVQRGPVRVGGQIKMPALLHRVEPSYPALALAAQIEGLVILEAVVDEQGQVEDVKVLRSGGVGGVFDREAVTAVRQWRYSPVILNGRPERFVLTVTLSFTLPDRRGGR